MHSPLRGIPPQTPQEESVGAQLGRETRWGHWNVCITTRVVALTISSIGYAASNEIWIFERGGWDTTLQPFHVKKSRTNLGVPSGRTDQAFGLWTGTFAADGVEVTFDRLIGWAEEVHNRW